MTTTHKFPSLVGAHADDVLPRVSASRLLPLLVFPAFLTAAATEEEGVEVGGAGAGLQRQDAATVLGQVKVLEHVKSLQEGKEKKCVLSI